MRNDRTFPDPCLGDEVLLIYARKKLQNTYPHDITDFLSINIIRILNTFDVPWLSKWNSINLNEGIPMLYNKIKN